MMEEREQQPSGEEEREQQPSAEEEREQQPSAEEEKQGEGEIEVSDLDVEEDEASSVKGGATLLENPSAGGEIRQR
jgi:hypothetical protein